MKRVVDLSHSIGAGQLTHPGLPAPSVEVFRSRREHREATGTEFQIDRVCLVGNTGTYLDSPFHRFPDGPDLAAVPLEGVVDLPIVTADVRGHRGVSAPLLRRCLPSGRLEGTAVLLHTGGDRHWGSPGYAVDAPHLTADGAAWLAAQGPSLVGIDAVNIDDLDDGERPAHTLLLRAGVLILEHLTGLAELGEAGVSGARLHAAPPAWHGVGTWPVRAYAVTGEYA